MIVGTKGKAVTCLGFYLIIQELLFKLGQSIVGAVVVQIQRIEDIPEEGKTTASSLLMVSLKAGRLKCAQETCTVGWTDSGWEKEALSACYDVSRLYLGNDLFYSLPTEIKAHDVKPEKISLGLKAVGHPLRTSASQFLEMTILPTWLGWGWQSQQGQSGW